MSSGNFMFFLLMMSGPLVSVSASNWLVCWIGIEISFLGLIPLMVSDSSNFSLSKESSVKYFCIQAFGSGLMLIGGIFYFMLPFDLSYFPEALMIFSILIKLGVFPAHFWVPSVVGGLSLLGMFLILTWQKIIPLMLMVSMLSSCPWLQEFLLVIGGVSSIVGALIGLNQTKLSPLLGASSITHGGWMVLGAVYGSVWVYFFIYCLSLAVLMLFWTTGDDMLIGFGVLSLSGLPPFLLFLGKWSVFKLSILSGVSLWFLFLPLLGSVMSLFFYLKFFYSSFLESGKISGLKLVGLGASSLVLFIGVMIIEIF